MTHSKNILPEAIGLIGLPNSGKTAFVYATCISHQQIGYGWSLGIKDPEVIKLLSELARSEGGERPLWQNTAAHLPAKSYRLFTARRPGILASFLQPAVSVSVPELPGELVLKAAGRGTIRDNADQKRVNDLIEHLRSCSGLICLIDPTLPDGDVAEQAEDLTNVISQVVAGRHGQKPLALSIALTKLDMVMRDPRRSVISLPEEDCLRLAYLNERKINPVAANIKLSRKKATYTLGDADLFRHPTTKAVDPEHNKAVVWDYLNAHLPSIARAARTWADDGRATVRAYMISNWGKPAPRDAKGREVVPRATKSLPCT